MAEKIESGPLKFFFNILMIFFILYVLLLSKCIDQMEYEISDGKAGCESVINECEEGRDEFLERHSDSLWDDPICP